MMKLIVSVFCISLLLAPKAGFAQRDHIFKSLDDALSVPFDSVFRLDLSKEKLCRIPEEIYRFTALQELNLSKNRLTDLPLDFHFPNLQTLNISRNKLTIFPIALCQIRNLQNLFMGKNEIKYLPDCVRNLQRLIVLDIWFNPLDDLPESMMELRNLRALDLSGISFNKTQQEKWRKMLPWVKIEFEAACNCNN